MYRSTKVLGLYGGAAVCRCRLRLATVYGRSVGPGWAWNSVQQVCTTGVRRYVRTVYGGVMDGVRRYVRTVYGRVWDCTASVRQGVRQGVRTVYHGWARFGKVVRQPSQTLRPWRRGLDRAVLRVMRLREPATARSSQPEPGRRSQEGLIDPWYICRWVSGWCSPA